MLIGDETHQDIWVALCKNVIGYGDCAELVQQVDQIRNLDERSDRDRNPRMRRRP